MYFINLFELVRSDINDAKQNLQVPPTSSTSLNILVSRVRILSRLMISASLNSWLDKLNQNSLGDGEGIPSTSANAVANIWLAERLKSQS